MRNEELLRAVRDGSVAEAKALLGQGADVNCSDEYGTTPLMWASSSGRVDVVPVLLEAGAEVNATNRYSVTALMIAAYNGHLPVVKLLVQGGADASMPHISGSTALHIAVQNKKLDVADYLRKAAAERVAAERVAAERVRIEPSRACARRRRRGCESNLFGRAHAEKVWQVRSAPSKAVAGEQARAAWAWEEQKHGNAAAEVEGLAQLLEGARLTDHLEAAIAWCTKQGADSIAMIKEVEMEQEFVQALQLKPMKAKQLLKRIAAL